MKLEDRIREEMGLVSPVLAEKLKECGFDGYCAFCYVNRNGNAYEVISAHGATDMFSIVHNSSLEWLGDSVLIAAPTVDAANEYLRGTYAMFISVEPYGCMDAIHYRYRVWSLDESNFKVDNERMFGGFASPREAMNEGILFVFEKILRL